MSSSSNMQAPFSLFPTSTAAPCAFGLFGQHPRDTHAAYEDLASLMFARPSSSSSAPSRERAVQKETTSAATGNSPLSLVQTLRLFFRSL